MAISQSSLTSGSSTTDTSSYSTASISPTANRLVLAFVSSRRGGANPSEPALSGASMTWTSVDSGDFGNTRITVFRSLNASPGSGAITIDFSAETQQNCHWSIMEISGIDTSGTNGAGAIVQSSTNADSGTSTSIVVTLAAISSAQNATFGGVTTIDRVTAGATPGSGFAEIHEVSTGTPQVPTNADARSTQTEWQIGTDNTVDWTFGDSDEIAAVAVEVKKASDANFFAIL